MSRLNKELGLLQGIALLSTSLLGTGIFVVPALAATAAGEASLWAWLMLIALVLPVAFTFAQLGKRFPHAGGAPHLIGRAFGLRMEGFIAMDLQPVKARRQQAEAADHQQPGQGQPPSEPSYLASGVAYFDHPRSPTTAGSRRARLRGAAGRAAGIRRSATTPSSTAR